MLEWFQRNNMEKRGRIESPKQFQISKDKLFHLIEDAPEPLRRYIYQLETRVDPSGDIQEIADLREQREALQVLSENDLATSLQRIYDSEINVRLSWLWDRGIDVMLGDEMNGYVVQKNVRILGDVLGWLQEAIAHFYPESQYAMSLGPDVHERAQRRAFNPRAS